MISAPHRQAGSLVAAGFVLACLVTSVAVSGEPRGALPPLNARVADFARAHLGEPVGDGICITLAVDALRAAGAQAGPLSDPSGEYVWGEPVADLKAVLPGDILQFRDAVFAGSRFAGKGRRVTWRETYAHHTAIVAKSEENGRLITIYHQNVALAGEDHARVGEVRATVLRLNSLQPGGQIHAYRPIPATTLQRGPRNFHESDPG